MSSTVLDLFIQDFVLSHRILNQRASWAALVSRRFVESNAQRKVFQFRSGDTDHFAVGTLLDLPDADCFRIELTHAASRLTEEHRLDCLRMMSVDTHNGMEVSKPDDATVVIRLTTRNRGLINVVFVVRDCLPLAAAVLASA
jgi:hypothetical protein